MAKKNSSFAEGIGALLAILQSAVDDLMTFLFKKLKSAGKPDEVEYIEPDGEPVEVKLKRGAKGVARFFGELGESYYETYEKLKKKK